MSVLAPKPKWKLNFGWSLMQGQIYQHSLKEADKMHKRILVVWDELD